MNEPRPPARTRDAARSREAILDAAERLFAEQGYAGASLEEIGRLAGVSRGAPGYFFGAKEALYRAVLTRVLTAEATLLLAAQARAEAAGGGPEQIVAALVESFFDFLTGRPSFVLLVEREALAGGAILREAAAETPEVQQGLASLGAALAGSGFRLGSPAEILLALLALTWFPLAHADGFTRALGFDAHDPAFHAAWKRFVIELALRGLRAG